MLKPMGVFMEMVVFGCLFMKVLQGVVGVDVGGVHLPTQILWKESREGPFCTNLVFFFASDDTRTGYYTTVNT